MVDLHNPNVVGTLTGVDLGSSNKIEQADSNVTVVDAGTGSITADVDGNERLNISSTAQTLGDSGDTNITILQSSNLVQLEGNNNVSAQFIGGAESALYYGGTRKFETTATGMKAGLDPFIFVDNADAETARFGVNEQILGGTRAGGASPRATLYVDNVTSDDIQISMGTGNHYYQIQDGSGGEGGDVAHEWFVSGTTAMKFDGLIQYLGNDSDTYVKVSQGSNEVEIGNASATLAVFGTSNRVDLYASNTKVLQTITTGIQGGVSAFDIKTSSGDDGLTINDNGSIEIFHNNAKVAETTSVGITGAVWG